MSEPILMKDVLEMAAAQGASNAYAGSPKVGMTPDQLGLFVMRVLERYAAPGQRDAIAVAMMQGMLAAGAKLDITEDLPGMKLWGVAYMLADGQARAARAPTPAPEAAAGAAAELQLTPSSPPPRR